ncbi:WD repeat-containing protein tag-125-like isoform X2 [Helicoverpa zea]|nr:WD repeat-containing protein tag-125-like isoform X2 [Helicoverpa zea]
MCCKYTEDVNEIAAGFTDGSMRVFSCNTGNCIHTLVDEECRAYPGPVTAIKHRPVSKANPITNMLLSSYVNGCIKCWKYKYDQCLYTIREKRQTLGLNYHPRYSKFVTYGDDAKLNMYDEEAQTQERAFYSSNQKNKLDGHTSRIFACAFNPRSQHEMISGGWDNTVMCWDDRQPYATRYFVGVHMCGEGLDFDKPGRQILTCSWQEKDSIQLWDYGSCKLIETIVPDSFQSKLYCGKMVPHTNLIVCGGSDSNILRVVDTNMKVTECSIRNNQGGIYAFDFGTIRRKPKKATDSYKKISEIPNVPRVSFVTGKRLQTVDFG